MVCLLGLTACEDEPSRSATASEEPAASATVHAEEADVVRAADYDTWQPSYRDVRAATAADIEVLRGRMADLAATSYTTRVPAMDLEIAHSPEHLRVRIGGAWTGGYDVHLDPGAMGEEMLDIGPFVVCSLDEDGCTEVGRDRKTRGGPHMFNNGLDTLIFTAGTIVQTQDVVADGLGRTPAKGTSLAVVDSPAGPLDCVVTGGTAAQHARLEGRAIDLSADPFSLGRRAPLSTICIDEHGLVVLALPSLLAPVVPYTSFEEGVPDGYDEHADPRPYGTTSSPSPSPSPSRSPSSPPASATESTGMVRVLVARELIEAGTSLEEVQQTGRLELTFVPDLELRPGAVSSTSGLDGIALRDIAAGAQITEDLFG